MHLLAHSMGGHLALRAAHYFGPRILSLALSAPMILPTPKPVRGVLWLARMLKLCGLSRSHVPFTSVPELETATSFVPSNQLTTDPAGFAWQTHWFKTQPDLRRYGATVGWVYAAYHSALKTVLRPSYLAAITAPWSCCSNQKMNRWLIKRPSPQPPSICRKGFACPLPKPVMSCSMKHRRLTRRCGQSSQAFGARKASLSLLSRHLRRKLLFNDTVS